MESNSELFNIGRSSIFKMDNLQTPLSESRNGLGRVKKGAIRKMIRSQKNFFDIFNKYQCEVRSLQAIIESKFERIRNIEEKLLGMTREWHAFSNAYLEKSNRQEHLSSQLKLIKNRKNFFHQQCSDKEFNNFSGYSQVVSSFIEPIVIVKEHGDQRETFGQQQQMDLYSKESETADGEHNTDTILSGANNEDWEAEEAASYNKSLVKKASKKVTIPVTSKTEFVQLVEKHKQSCNLTREKVGENVFALCLKEDDSVLGYQCSILGCNFMHFLKAQVNRHFKNYHSKTCSHCNQRFSKPFDLLRHLNENQLTETNLVLSCQQ